MPRLVAVRHGYTEMGGASLVYGICLYLKGLSQTMNESLMMTQCLRGKRGSRLLIRATLDLDACWLANGGNERPVGWLGWFGRAALCVPTT
jgi:hypothetical protein